MTEVDKELRRRNEVRFSLLQFAIEVGVIRDVRDHIEWLSGRVRLNEEKKRIEASSLYLERMEAFEAIYGPGSCINLQHEFVKQLVGSRNHYFTAKALTNARAVTALHRAEFLEAVREPA